MFVEFERLHRARVSKVFEIVLSALCRIDNEEQELDDGRVVVSEKRPSEDGRGRTKDITPLMRCIFAKNPLEAKTVGSRT